MFSNLCGWHLSVLVCLLSVPVICFFKTYKYICCLSAAIHSRQHRIASRQASYLILIWPGLQESLLNSHKLLELNIRMKFPMLNKSTFCLGACHNNLWEFFQTTSTPFNLSGECVWHIEVFHLLPSGNYCCCSIRIWSN